MKLTVIVPCKNELPGVRPFYDRMSAALKPLEPGLDWEIVYMDDGSDDGTGTEVLKLRELDKRVKLITLSRSFGYQPVLLAGLTARESDLYSVVDVDCEDPPELLPKFLEAIKAGADVAYGIRSNREEPGLIVWLRGLFYKINCFIADGPAVLWMAEFGMYTRRVRDAVLASRSTFPFVRNEISYAGFKRVGIDYLRAKRAIGQSHYNLWRMARFAVAGYLTSSTFPLRMTLYLAAALAGLFPLLAFALGLSWEGAGALAAVLNLYFCLAAVPFISLYLARTYHDTQARPVFLIDEKRSHL